MIEAHDYHESCFRSAKRAPWHEAIESFDVFPWNGDFETGVPLVDEQHQTLVRMLNMVARNLVIESDSLSFDEALRELSDYATYHSATEEDLVRQVFGCDVLGSGHQQAQREFVEEIGRLTVQSGATPARIRSEEIVACSSRWLAYHILDVDRCMAKVLLAIQAGMPLEAAKVQAHLEMSETVRVLIDAVLDMYEKLSSRTFQLMKEIAERKEVERQCLPVQQIEWEHIQRVLLNHDGNISSAARALNIHRRTLQRKVRKHMPR